jgi:hypothetical protein
MPSSLWDIASIVLFAAIIVIGLVFFICMLLMYAIVIVCIMAKLWLDERGFTCKIFGHLWITWYDLDGMKKHCSVCNKIVPHSAENAK